MRLAHDGVQERPTGGHIDLEMVLRLVHHRMLGCGIGITDPSCP